MNKTASFVQSSLFPYRFVSSSSSIKERMSWSLISPSIALLAPSPNLRRYGFRRFRIRATAEEKPPKEELKESPFPSSSSLKKVVNKTAATFAPRASTASSKNPAVPGTTLYQVFEVQGYASMLLGGVLSFNLLFPSNEPDLWRLMGMWSIWMFSKSLSQASTSFQAAFHLPLNSSLDSALLLINMAAAIPSLRARDCPSKEKEALNYLFLIIPLLNVAIPFFWKSFALVWSADTLAFFAMYAWKVFLLQSSFLPNYFFFLVVALAHIRFCLLLQLGWLERTD